MGRTLSRRGVVCGIGGSALALGIAALPPGPAVAADFYHGKTLTLIVGFAPGGGVDIVDRECNVAEARCVRRRGPGAILARGRAELRQLQSSMAVRGLHDRDVGPDAVEPHDAVHPAALDRFLTQ